MNAIEQVVEGDLETGRRGAAVQILTRHDDPLVILSKQESVPTEVEPHGAVLRAGVGGDDQIDAIGLAHRDADAIGNGGCPGARGGERCPTVVHQAHRRRVDWIVRVTVGGVDKAREEVFG